MKVKFYPNLATYENDNKKTAEQITVVNRGKYIDVDCFMVARNKYGAFKKLKTALVNEGYESLVMMGLEQDMQYKEEFLTNLTFDCYHYPSETRNGYYGYCIESVYDNRYYLRYFVPVQ